MINFKSADNTRVINGIKVHKKKLHLLSGLLLLVAAVTAFGCRTKAADVERETVSHSF